MSHLTYVKTRFQNLFYLEKALNKLDIVYKHSQKSINDSKSSNINIVIPGSNGYDIDFCWNGEEYEIIVDNDFWQKSPFKQQLSNKIAQEYAGEVIIGESQKIGFEPVKYQQNSDGSNTITLERWSSN